MEKALTKYFWIFNLATLAAVAFLLASGTGEMVAASVTELLPQPEQTESRGPRAGKRPRAIASYAKRDGSDILRRNIFDSQIGPILRSDEEVLDDSPTTFGENGEISVTPCPGGGVTVLSTVASPANPEWSFATLNAGGQTDLFRIGDEVDGRTIHDISWRYVFLRGTSDICYVDMFGADEPGKPRPKRTAVVSKDDDIANGIQVDGPNERTVDRSVVDKALANPTQFARSVRVRPYKKNGEITGFRLRRIKKGSPLELLGAQKGDIIHSVNGVPLTSVDQALAAYQNMRNESKLTFSVTRKGRPTDLVINIK